LLCRTKEILLSSLACDKPIQENWVDIIVLKPNSENMVLMNAFRNFTAPESATTQLVWVAAFRKKKIVWL
jgi:hypothetical protein